MNPPVLANPASAPALAGARRSLKAAVAVIAAAEAERAKGVRRRDAAIRQLSRLGMSNRQIAGLCQLSHTAIADILRADRP